MFAFDKNLEWGEVVAECNIMMNAGSVTTAVAIANVMYQLDGNSRSHTTSVHHDVALGNDLAPFEVLGVSILMSTS
jgi:hypothetical protein